jgi:hypothetical protein
VEREASVLAEELQLRARSLGPEQRAIDLARAYGLGQGAGVRIHAELQRRDVRRTEVVDRVAPQLDAVGGRPRNWYGPVPTGRALNPALNNWFASRSARRCCGRMPTVRYARNGA